LEKDKVINDLLGRIANLEREVERLNNIIDKAIELLTDENYLDKLDCYTYPKEVIEILKGEDKEWNYMT
jgi:mannitol/fructose-specific phosphotransferase system IIA component (Ntr-type)